MCEQGADAARSVEMASAWKVCITLTHYSYYLSPHSLQECLPHGYQSSISNPESPLKSPDLDSTFLRTLMGQLNPFEDEMLAQSEYYLNLKLFKSWIQLVQQISLHGATKQTLETPTELPHTVCRSHSSSSSLHCLVLSVLQGNAQVPTSLWTWLYREAEYIPQFIEHHLVIVGLKHSSFSWVRKQK